MKKKFKAKPQGRKPFSQPVANGNGNGNHDPEQGTLLQ